MKRFALTLGMLLMLTGCATTSCLTNLQPWPDPSGTHINLQQCWDKSDQIRFYTTNQGSQIAPYDLIKYLEMPLSTDKFFSRHNFKNGVSCHWNGRIGIRTLMWIRTSRTGPWDS